ncbi:hypothetical protein ACFWZ7_24945 [Nocardiopsis alba]|uniref:hypothetical protein n=1 Tax=Nocardiopsis alba TaxID=53437 RepID=UPI00366D1B7C
MSSTLSIAQIAETTGATRPDVIRVLNHGGTTQHDWDIAYAIEAAGGRRATDLMFAAGRDAEIARIWADSRAEAEPVAPTNPEAEHDKNIRIYPEHTSPDETREVIPHHPGDTTEAPTEQETLQIQTWAAVADITGGNCAEVDRLVADWTSIEDIRIGITRLLAASGHPRARRLHATYVTAA